MRAKARNIITGIDIGTYQIKVIVSEKTEDGFVLLGTGFASSKGIEKGAIINVDLAFQSINEAVGKAEKMAGVQIKEALVAVNNADIEAVGSVGSYSTTKADLEITELDIKKAIENSEEKLPEAMPSVDYSNCKIITNFELRWRIDGKKTFVEPPIGIHSKKIEVQSLFIVCLKKHYENILKVFDKLEIEILEILPAPMVAGRFLLLNSDKKAGCMLAIFGSETTSIIVYEHNVPVSMEIIPIGSDTVTEQIAMSLQIPISKAEQIKHGEEIGVLPKIKLEEGLLTGLNKLFVKIEDHINTRLTQQQKFLPGGIIFTGGGAELEILKTAAKSYFSLPTQTIQPEYSNRNPKIHIRKPQWTTAYSLCLYGISEFNETHKPSIIKVWFEKIYNKIKILYRQVAA
jgi:cell division protein FtsA